jgi:vancomycin resistance protein YoaR
MAAYTVTVEENTQNVVVEVGTQGPPGSVSGTVDASTIAITPHGTITTSTLQAALEQLADNLFQQSTEPVANIEEGDIWYDTTADKVKVYRNGAWEDFALSADLDTATMNGGYF